MNGEKRGANTRIRTATPFDASLLTALHRTCFGTEGHPHGPRAWDEAAMAQFIAAPSALCLLAAVAAEAPQPAGFIIARGGADQAELLTIGVLPEFRELGIGSSMIRQAVIDLMANGAKTLFLEVDDTNQPAQALYRSLGATTVGSRSGYYENGHNAAILRLNLEPCPLGPANRL